jgi:DHA1 family tetracycline resistance protein-like MFS transporter
MLAAPLLALVSHYPAGDWRIGAPFYFCSAMQLASLGLAVIHFRRHRRTADATDHACAATEPPVKPD